MAAESPAPPAGGNDRGFRITELRVHGVGGAAPEDVLDVPHTRLVAGGPDAGFFRPAEWIAMSGPKRNLEAYSWGGITSRSRTRALWLFLLPFALLNVAGWMDERDDAVDTSTPRRRRLALAAFRLEGLVTTAIFTTLIAILTIEIAGYRCVASSRCDDAWYLTPWSWANDPVDRIAVGIAAAALIMLAISLIARAGLLGLRNQPDGGQSVHSDPARSLSLDSTELWRRPDIARRLGMIHISVTLALVSLLGIEAAATAAQPGAWATTLQLVGGTIIIGGVAAVSMLGPTPRWAYWALAAASGALVLVTVILVWRLPAPMGEAIGEEIISATAGFVFVVFLLLLLARWARYIWGYLVVDSFRKLRRVLSPAADRRDPDELAAPPVGLPDRRLVLKMRRWAAGLWDEEAPPILSLRAAVPVLGAAIAVAVGSSILLRFQEILGTDYPTRFLNRVAVFGLVWVGLVALTAWWVLFSHPGRPPATIVTDDLGEDFAPRGEEDANWLRKISSAESAAHIADRAATIITVPAVVLLFVAPLASFSERTDAFVEAVAGPTAWILSLLPLGLMFAMNSLYRSRNFRRSLGIIWDIATLWPRWFHPWAPPSYGERAVPHLCRRIQELTKGDGAVILSAHSQGTVVVAAALAQLPADARSRVAVVTHGSPLTRLYAAYFARLFSVQRFQELAEQLTPSAPVAWRNLYRYTDYIGGPVFTEEVTTAQSATDSRYEDMRLRDPHDPAPLMTGDPRPPTLNHSNYYRDPAYAETISEFISQLGG